MVLETIISSKYRIVTIVTLAILAAGLLGQLISTAIWWSRMQPWFGYGRGYYRVVYNCVFACFILSLIGFVALVVVGAINIFAKELYAKITGSLVGTTLVITVVGACALAGLIPGAYGASWAVDRYKLPTFKKLDLSKIGAVPDPTQPILEYLAYFQKTLENIEKDAETHFCMGYVAIKEILEKNGWPEGTKKRRDYDKWAKKADAKAYEGFKVEGGQTYEKYISETKEAISNNPKLGGLLASLDVSLDDIPDALPRLTSPYLCEEVGIPTLIFTMITALSMIVFFYLIVFNAYSQSDASEAEA